MQEQESDSLPIENNPAVADIQTVDSLVQHTTDDKKIVYLFYPSTTIMNQKSCLTFADTNVESLEPIQPDTIGASSVVLSSQIEAISEKVPY